MSIKFILLFILLSLFFNVYADVYTWTDENGKTHFGDKIPLEYQDKVSDIEVKTHNPSEEEIKAVKDRTNSAINNSLRHQQVENAKEQNDSSTSKTKEKKYSSEYERQLAEYEESVSCFNACANTSYTGDVMARQRDGSYFRAAGSGRVIRDTSNCGHCKDLKRPKKP